jgi:hypothetical protein
VIAPAPHVESGQARSNTRLFVVSQPPLYLRLSTYPSELTDGNIISLGSAGFARHYYRHRCLLSFPRGTKMFQFPRFPPNALYIQAQVTRHDSSRVSPFGHLRFKACLAAPRSLSQPTTSFIGILRQGIRCVRLSNFLRRLYMSEDMHSLYFD